MAVPIYKSSPSSMKGYLAYAANLIRDGGAIPFIKSTSSGDAVIYTIKPKSIVNTQAIEKLNNLAKEAKLNTGMYQQTLKAIDIEVNENIQWAPKAANIMKSGERVPKGYYAETILQAAIAARFVDARSSSKKVTPSMVVKHLTQFLTTNSDSAAQSALSKYTSSKSTAIAKTFEYSVANDNENIGNDTVYVLYTLNESSFKFLKQIKKLDTDPNVKPFLDDSVSFVNSGSVVEHSNYFFTNGRVDRIDILSLGISGQGKTKADIKTQYYEGWNGGSTGTPHTMTLNLSVKIKHVEQIGQLTGITSEKLSQLAELIGAKLQDSTKKRIDEIVSQGFDKDTKQLTAGKKGQTEIYNLAYTDMLNTVGNTAKLFQGVEHFIALTEANSLDIVDIGSGLRVYFVKNLKQLAESCKGSRATAKLHMTKSDNYELTVFVDNKEILKFSSRFTGNTYRNFVLTGEALRQTLSSKI